MIDFKVKGTKLPVIPVGLSYRVTSWELNTSDGDINESKYWHSYDAIVYQLETYILAEKSGYNGTNFFMIKESDIIRLAKEQGMIKDEFVLPDEWYVIVTEENKKTLSQWIFGNNTTDILEIGYVVGMYHWSDNNFSKEYNPTPNGWKNKITFDQFKKYVLKQDTMEKEIIGYKLKEDCEKYREAAERIVPVNSEYFNGKTDYLIYPAPTGYHCSVSVLKEAGVLDLWFDPVYADTYKVGDWIIDGNDEESEAGKITSITEIFYCINDGNPKAWSFNKSTPGLRLATPKEIENSKYPNITINGYKGEFFNDYVKFRCAEISKDCFINLFQFAAKSYKGQNKGIESVTIGKGTFTKEQIKEIAEYYNARNSK